MNHPLKSRNPGKWDEPPPKIAIFWKMSFFCPAGPIFFLAFSGEKHFFRRKMGGKRGKNDLFQIIEDCGPENGEKTEKKASGTPENGEKTAYSHPGKRRTEKKTEKKTARLYVDHFTTLLAK